MKNKALTSFLLAIFLLTSGFGCKIKSEEVVSGTKPITITYWRVWDNSDLFADVIAKYKAIHPNVTIQYKKFRYEEYEDQLINAFAEDRGPDIFSIPNTWIRRYQTKIEPLPVSTALVYKVVQGSIKKEVIDQIKTNNTMTVDELKRQFVDVVYDDVVIKGIDPVKKTPREQIYGLPLYIDTLALYYNKDLFNNAGIAEPPVYWDRTFQQYVKKLTKQDTKGEIIQSGVAMGGSSNVQRSFDIVSILMMQNGAKMMSDNGQITFNLMPQDQTIKYNPGLEALRFYTDFANPSKEVYSWNKNLEDSLKMFMNNQLAMMFGYSYFLPTIKAEAPKLNLGITKLPQIENSSKAINYANYWVETVSKKIMTNPQNVKDGTSKLKRDSAWDFIQFMAKEEQAKPFLEKVNRPSALRSLIEQQTQKPELGIFASQVLTSESWYRGKNSDEAEKLFNQMIDESITNPDQIEAAIGQAANRVQQTVN